MPSLERRMTAFGENIRLARLRRRLTASQVAERAGISRQTLSAAEHGDPAVSFGVYANILFVLGLDKDLDALGRDDELGRKLQDAGLLVPKRVRRNTATRNANG
jgi:transcriptional regulator with XRE-family HTH domain